MNEMHPFERAGLGKAPFRFAGWYESKFQAIPGDPSCPIQPGSSCDYCAQGIMIVCRIESADGREFKVGQDCCRKCDKKLADAVQMEQRRRDKAKRDAKAGVMRDELRLYLADDATRCALAARPHPKPEEWRAAEDNTLLAYAEFMLKRAGAAGRAKALKLVKEALK